MPEILSTPKNKAPAETNEQALSRIAAADQALRGDRRALIADARSFVAEIFGKYLDDVEGEAYTQRVSELKKRLESFEERAKRIYRATSELADSVPFSEENRPLYNELVNKCTEADNNFENRVGHFWILADVESGEKLNVNIYWLARLAAQELELAIQKYEEEAKKANAL